MTTQEHLNAIVAKCKSLLELAERRTQGSWTPDGGWVAKGYTVIATTHHGSRHADSAYIAACAGSAEAGWRATIAAIEGIQSLHHSEGPRGTYEMCSAILAAWPEELLK